MDARAVGVLVCCLLAASGAAGSAVGSGPALAETSDRDPAALADGVDEGAGQPLFQDGNGTDNESDGEGGETNESDGGGESDGEANESDDGSGTDGAGDEIAAIEGYDTIHVGISIEEGNGSARWTVEYRYRLDGDDETDAWLELRDDVRADPDAYVSTFERRWVDQLDAAVAQTGREMALSAFDVDATQRSGVQNYGFLTFEFRWSSFAHVELNRVEVGDALEGFVLDDRTHLLIEWPPEYETTRIAPPPDDRRETSVAWYGDETAFVDEEPRIELIRMEEGADEQPGDADDDVPRSWLAATAAALLAVVGAAGWLAVRDRTAPDGGTSATEPSGDARAATDDADPPPELLSNEEHVLRLLADNGGRIKQQEVVSELGWTEAKTSQVVGDLREAGAIEVFRIGRENVLALPDGGKRDDEVERSGDGEE